MSNVSSFFVFSKFLTSYSTSEWSHFVQYELICLIVFSCSSSLSFFLHARLLSDRYFTKIFLHKLSLTLCQYQWNYSNLKIVYLETNKCLRCSKLEKELKDLKAERDTLKNKISQLEDMSADDEQKRIGTKTKDEIIKDLVEEKKMMRKQIEGLKAKEGELKLKLQVQTNPEELDQLKFQIFDLLNQIEELNRKEKSSESEC